jgi:nicotinamide-nucleotide amidase
MELLFGLEVEMFTDQQLNVARDVINACSAKRLKLATAESCTGGLISGCLTAIAGSSEVFERGFVTYTNEAKSDLLGVAPELFKIAGAVSEEVACAMAEGALKNSNAQLSVSVTGIAGPGGGTNEKPVGLVHIASARKNLVTLHERHVFKGGRDEVRGLTVLASLNLMLEQIN